MNVRYFLTGNPVFKHNTQAETVAIDPARAGQFLYELDGRLRQESCSIPHPTERDISDPVNCDSKLVMIRGKEFKTGADVRGYRGSFPNPDLVRMWYGRLSHSLPGREVFITGFQYPNPATITCEDLGTFLLSEDQKEAALMIYDRQSLRFDPSFINDLARKYQVSDK